MAAVCPAGPDPMMTTWECFLPLFSPPAFGSEMETSLIVDLSVSVLSKLMEDKGKGVWRWVAWGGVEVCIERLIGLVVTVVVIDDDEVGILGLRIADENALVALNERDSLVI